MAVERNRRHVAERRKPAAAGPRAASLTVLDPGANRADLISTIESQIIPRLLLAHRDELAISSCAPARPLPTQEEIHEMVRLAACHDLVGVLRMVETICRQGLGLDLVLLELVAPAARLLGDQWLDDRRSFTEVTAGLGTLQQAVHVLGPSFAPDVPHRGLVVLVAAPGEQHTLGLYLVGEFLRRGGWGVHVEPAMSEEGLTALLATQWVEVLGVSVSGEERLGELPAFLARVRATSSNPAMGILLGGSVDLTDFARENQIAFASPAMEEVMLWFEQRAMSA